MHAIEYDGKALLNFKQSKKAATSPNKAPSISANYPASQQVSQLQPSVPVASMQPPEDARVVVGGYNGDQVTRYLAQTHPQQLPTSSQMQFQEPPFFPQNQFIGSSNSSQVTRNSGTDGLALGPSQQQSLEFQHMGQLVRPSDLNSSDDWSHQGDSSRGVDDFYSEEEIRMRSHEILENEDMQHLLRVFSMGGANAHEDGFGFPPYVPSPCPNFNFDEERSRSSGKAVVGWLKIKAAMRWGIFIRKKAAERRAQLIELED